MPSETLIERRKWLRIFPEGLLEFLIITRIFGLMMLVALAVVTGTQRPLVLTVLALVLWVDYALIMWWAVQVTDDLRLGTGAAAAEQTAPVRASPPLWAVVVVLPSVLAVVVLAPWTQLLALFTSDASAHALARVAMPAAVIGYLVSLVPAYRVLRKMEVGSPLVSVMCLVPLIHWLGQHRLAGQIGTRLEEQLIKRGDSPEMLVRAKPVLLAADLLWVLSILPWAVLFAISTYRGWPTGSASKLMPVCGTCLASLFAITNLAGLERVQRQVVRLVRKP